MGHQLRAVADREGWALRRGGFSNQSGLASDVVTHVLPVDRPVRPEHNDEVVALKMRWQVSAVAVSNVELVAVMHQAFTDISGVVVSGVGDDEGAHGSTLRDRSLRDG